jgi:hypothetical protein
MRLILALKGRNTIDERKSRKSAIAHQIPLVIYRYLITFAEIFYMKNVLLVIGVLIAALAGTYFFYLKPGDKADNGPKEKPLAVSKYGDAFTKSMSTMMDAYFQLTESLVVWDTMAVNTHAGKLKTALDSVKLEDVKKDTVIYETAIVSLNNAKAEMEGMLKETTLRAKKEALNMLSQQLRDLLITLQYNQQKIYWEECPMAFDGATPANWLGVSLPRRNPYLGTSDPAYGNKMLHCGETKDSINYAAIK